MSESKGPGNDSSMDDILASIRKIISDDEARGSTGRKPDATTPAGSQPAEAGKSAAQAAASDDVLLLTDLVDGPTAGPPPSRPTLVPPVARIDTGSATPAAAAIAPASNPVIPPSPLAQPPGQSVGSTPISATPSASSAESPVKQPPAEKNLMEPGAAGIAASAFDRLSHAVQDSVPQPTATDPGPSVGPSGRTLEDIVKEMLRPMLKEWLDKNLPTVVERLVEREIVRLTRR